MDPPPGSPVPSAPPALHDDPCGPPSDFEEEDSAAVQLLLARSGAVVPADAGSPSGDPESGPEEDEPAVDEGGNDTDEEDMAAGIGRAAGPPDELTSDQVRVIVRAQYGHYHTSWLYLVSFHQTPGEELRLREWRLRRDFQKPVLFNRHRTEFWGTQRYNKRSHYRTVGVVHKI